MPGTDVDVCICFSNNCNGRKSNDFGMNDERESNDWEINSYKIPGCGVFKGGIQN